MMELIGFKPEHVLGVKLQSMQDETPALDLAYAEQLVALSNHALTAIDGSEIIACFGAAQVWRNRYTMWALLSKSTGKHMFALVNAGERIASLCNGRIDAIVRADFEQAHRLMRKLKFTPECYHRQYLPNGMDAYEYVRFS